MSSFCPIPDLTTGFLETAFNQVLRMDNDTWRRMLAFSGKIIEINFGRLETSFYVLITPSGLRVMKQLTSQPHVIFRGTPIALAYVGKNRKASGGAFEVDFEINGDIELGREIKTLVDGLDIDFEEIMSRFVGDLIAHQTTHSAYRVLDLGASTAKKAGHDMADAVTDADRGVVAPGSGLHDFSDRVDDLSEAAERLGARINQLDSKH